jgi:hypothetical protein
MRVIDVFQPSGTLGGAPMTTASQTWKDVPVDWEALEDAFENNAPEVHSYLHVKTGEVLRVVDGIADPDMHSRIALDVSYMRIDPVSSREQYRWMERFIPMVEEPDIQARLMAAIDGKGAFRRFKDVLMAFAPERERWFAFRSERLRVFMEAWLNAHGLRAIARPQPPIEPAVPPVSATLAPEAPEPVPSSAPERGRAGSDLFKKQLAEIVEGLTARDLDKLVAFAEFLKARRSARSYSGRGEGQAAARPLREPAFEARTLGASALDAATPGPLGDSALDPADGPPPPRRIGDRR